MELNLGPVRLERNPVNGQFLKGHKSFSAGKKRSEYMSEETDRMLKEIGGKRLASLPRCPYSGPPKRPVIMLTDDGQFVAFKSINEAAVKLSINPQNIARCCNENRDHPFKERTWARGITKAKGSNYNTDHRYKGLRWYYESDDTWINKIKQ